jgi:hypothetical protein
MKSKYTAGKTVLASSVFLGMAIGTAHAEICYKLNPFIDVIRVAETKFLDEAPNGSHILVVGEWSANRSFAKPVVGSLDSDLGGTGQRLSLHGTLHGSDCSGHSDITLDGVIGSTWNLSCDGKVAGFFNNTGTPLSVVSCDSVGPSVAAVGKSATQP